MCVFFTMRCWSLSRVCLTGLLCCRHINQGPPSRHLWLNRQIFETYLAWMTSVSSPRFLNFRAFRHGDLMIVRFSWRGCLDMYFTVMVWRSVVRDGQSHYSMLCLWALSTSSGALWTTMSVGSCVFGDIYAAFVTDHSLLYITWFWE